MTRRNSPVPRGPALPAAALAALLLAGCSSGHVGESWQCPLAEGGLCDSVAAADPAVPHADAARKTVLAGPLYRVREGTAAGISAAAGGPCPAACGGGFDPFGWLMRLLGAADGRDGEARPAAMDAGAARTAAAGEAPSSTRDGERSGPDGPAAAALPAGPPSAEREADAGDLRTGEIVARIWIAPFVDRDGVYREGSYVRVVLEPSGWRLR